MKKSDIHKLAMELWVRDNTDIFKYVSKWLNLSEDNLKLSGHWWIAQSRIALKIMREKRRKAKWERY